MNHHNQESFWVRCGFASGGRRRDEMRFAGMTLAWAISFTGCTFLIKSDLLPGGPIPWVVAALPSVAAVIVLIAYVRFLRQADELQRIIQLQALAVGFGGGFFAICGYSLFELLGAPATDNVDIMTLMPLFYVLGMLIGWTRYR